MDQAKFSWMIRRVRSARVRAVSRRERSSASRMASALFFARSVPPAMAKEAWAPASTGASLMPSPTMMLISPAVSRALRYASLPSGVTPFTSSSTPSSRATVSA
ncbi:hypothetical protein D3C80_1594090 [compost metagenome]